MGPTKVVTVQGVNSSLSFSLSLPEKMSGEEVSYGLRDVSLGCAVGFSLGRSVFSPSNFSRLRFLWRCPDEQTLLELRQGGPSRKKTSSKKTPADQKLSLGL